MTKETNPTIEARKTIVAGILRAISPYALARLDEGAQGRVRKGLCKVISRDWPEVRNREIYHHVVDPVLALPEFQYEYKGALPFEGRSAERRAFSRGMAARVIEAVGGFEVNDKAHKGINQIVHAACGFSSNDASRLAVMQAHEGLMPEWGGDRKGEEYKALSVAS